MQHLNNTMGTKARTQKTEGMKLPNIQYKNKEEHEFPG